MLTRDALMRLCRARDLLRDVHDQPLSIRDIAREAGISPYHFIRQFEALFGTTPHQYRIGARIELAKDLRTRTRCSEARKQRRKSKRLARCRPSWARTA